MDRKLVTTQPRTWGTTWSAASPSDPVRTPAQVDRPTRRLEIETVVTKPAAPAKTVAPADRVEVAPVSANEPARTPFVKMLAKWVAHAVATLAVAPMVVWYLVVSVVRGPDRALEGASQALALLPGLPGVYLRRAFLARVLARCDRSAEVSFGTLFSQADAEIGENVYVGPNCCLGLVRLEKDVLIGAGVHIPSGGKTHSFDDPARPIREQGGERRRVTIGEGAWVGSAAVVLADVGTGTVVGAGSVVTRPLPDFVIAAGNPARVIRPRFAAATE